MPVVAQIPLNVACQTPNPNSVEFPEKHRDWPGIGQSIPHIHPAAFPFVVGTSVAHAGERANLLKNAKNVRKSIPVAVGLRL
jgi:hypothetical protein